MLLSPDQTGNVRPGGQHSFSHVITNSSSVDDVFLLTTVSDQGWIVTHLPSITLSACTASTFSLQVSVPQTISVGSTGEINITATSSSDTQVQDSVTDVLVISPHVNFLPLVQVDRLSVQSRYNDIFGVGFSFFLKSLIEPDSEGNAARPCEKGSS